MGDFEVIVVDDGSPDATALESALAPYRERITFLRQDNQGVAAARNAAARVARGQWLAFLDGDDSWSPDFLEAQLQFGSRYGLQMVWSNGELLGGTRRVGERILAVDDTRIAIGISDLISEELFVITSATVVSTDVYRAVGGFDERLRRAQDFDLWIRLLNARVRVGYNPKPLMQYRVRSGSLSGDQDAQTARALGVLEHIDAHHSLESADRTVIRDRIHIVRAKLAVVDGKAHLRAGEMREALDAFTTAHSRLRTFKLRVVMAAVRTVPRLARWAYLRFSPDQPA